MKRVLEHRPRAIRPQKRWRHDGWEMIYGIHLPGRRLDPELVAIAERIAVSTLPRPARTPERYGVGFAIVHQADMFHQIVVDWWERVNELRHHVFKATPETPREFRNITATGEAFCVWELAVIGFERDAWMDKVLQAPDGPDLAAYLSASFRADM